MFHVLHDLRKPKENNWEDASLNFLEKSLLKNLNCQFIQFLRGFILKIKRQWLTITIRSTKDFFSKSFVSHEAKLTIIYLHCLMFLWLFLYWKAIIMSNTQVWAFWNLLTSFESISQFLNSRKLFICINEKEWAPLSTYFRTRLTDSFVKLVSIASGVSLWYRPCSKKYVKLWQRQQMPKTYDNIKVGFLWL